MTPIAEFFKGDPAAHASAPGRVNLLGEHTDYNDGFVLPTAIPPQTRVDLGYNEEEIFHCYSANLDRHVRFAPDESAPDGFARYIEGCVRLIEQRFRKVPPLKIYVSSDVPIGSGLSSSAALEVALLRALRGMFELKIDDEAIALIAQQAEIRYAHVNCGVMDQMASSLADSEHMLFLDTRSLERRLIALPPHSELVVIDSGVPRTLAASKYNERRGECEQAAKLLAVPALRDVQDQVLVAQLPEPLCRRARHVVSENERVLEVAHSPGMSAQRFGELMNASHVSLRDDYEVSIPALDQLVDLMTSHPAIYGARLTGAGFGGACIALCRRGEAEAAAAEILSKYNQNGVGRILVPKKI